MKRELGDGFELDDDLERIDVAEVRAVPGGGVVLGARARARGAGGALREAARVVGLYHEGSQIGFCRAARLSPQLFYLADVYVLPAYRGRGLGNELVREMLEHGPHPGAKWLLHTDDAHDLYRRFGFGDPDRKLMERRRPARRSLPARRRSRGFRQRLGGHRAGTATMLQSDEVGAYVDRTGGLTGR